MRLGGRRDYVALVILFTATLPMVNPYIRGDGNGYYAYLRSLAIDGDLQFDNEYRRGDEAFQTILETDGRVLPTGYRRNQHGVGPSMLWAPFFLAAHGGTRVAHALGAPLAPDGFSALYRWTCAIATSLYAFAGLLLSYGMARRFAGRAPALLAVVGIWFASSLPVYMYGLPFHVHALTAFTTAVFLWLWFNKSESPAAPWWMLWGAAGGLVVVTYQAAAALLLIAALELVRLWHRESTRPLLAAKGAFGFGFLAAVLPAAVIKSIIHGSPVGRYDYAVTLFYWTDPRLWQVGFSAEHGMFLWTPILVPAVLGLGVVCARDRWRGRALAAVSAVFYYVIASYLNWHGQSSFGSRFAVALTPIFVIGLAAALDRAYAVRWSRALAPAAVAALIAWNVGFIFQWAVNVVPNRGPVDFGVVAANQFTTVPRMMAGFLVRYFGDRDGVVRDVWRDDLIEAQRYELRR